MFSKKQVLLLCSLVALVAALATSAIFAQDDMMDEKIACDSTLAVLLLAAEHDFDYLSSKMMSEEMMNHPALSIDKGQYTSLVDSVVAMMTAMMEEDPMMGMSEEEMMAYNEMLASMMAMSPADMVHAYEESMGMTMEEGMMMTMLPPGNIPGENPTCAEVRADVEAFIIAHIITEANMMMMAEGQ